jgi:hypothetical protein
MGLPFDELPENTLTVTIVKIKKRERGLACEPLSLFSFNALLG